MSIHHKAFIVCVVLFQLSVEIDETYLSRTETRHLHGCWKTASEETPKLWWLQVRLHLVFVVVDFLPFIYFISFREQDKADINSLRWSAPVGLEPVYACMWVTRSTTVLHLVWSNIFHIRLKTRVEGIPGFTNPKCLLDRHLQTQRCSLRAC